MAVSAVPPRTVRADGALFTSLTVPTLPRDVYVPHAGDQWAVVVLRPAGVAVHAPAGWTQLDTVPGVEDPEVPGRFGDATTWHRVLGDGEEGSRPVLLVLEQAAWVAAELQVYRRGWAPREGEPADALGAVGTWGYGTGGLMGFEVFDRNQVKSAPAIDVPMVKVSLTGRLLFNRAAFEFLLMHSGPPGHQREVVLAFDAETRTVGVQPLRSLEEVAAGARWQVTTMRSINWAKGIDARPFVEHYQVAVGEYPARLLRGPGPRMVTFEVGRSASLPVGVPPGAAGEDL
jgi:hypothetical protein